ncbi:MAG: FIST C-terminal domain-containing protein [Lachnospiraceae bacterium]|nr:FIST C-terminal domain-containing protein [Lachnospiraceae bacterium]
MNSLTIYTNEIDDLEEAASELFAQAEGFVFKRNTLGILFAEDESDYDGLYELLAEKWDFPIIGCTAMAVLLGDIGYCGTGISIMLLTADDCDFSIGMTDELNSENFIEKIFETYRELKSSLPGEVKLVLTYGAMSTGNRNVSGDELVHAIDIIAGGIPIYGGLASDGLSFDKFRLFYNSKTSRTAQVLVLISGNIDPRFICVNSIENRANFYYEVTKSHSNKVDRLGNETFVDALIHENLEVESTGIQGAYLLSPFVFTLKKPNGDSLEVARTLMSLDRETGAGNFIGGIPEGASLSIGIISQNDVQKSVKKAFDYILNELKSTEPECHTLLCNSCLARFLALASNTTAEAEAYTGSLPEGVSLMGMYADGEICPVKGDISGLYYNMFHNFTFTILAF